MPLRDHFRPPVTDRHSWDELHGGWPMKIVESLLPVLPRGFLAAPQIHLGGTVEVDVATFDSDEPTPRAGSANGAGATATATWAATEPTLRVETDLPDVDEYEVRVYDVTRGRRLVAAVELVSPSNKDRPDTRQAFVAKCAALLQQKVSVTIVDVVTIREFNLYAELLTFLGQTDSSLAARPSSTYAVACHGTRPRKRWLLEGWHRPLVLGQPLPTLPLWLSDELAVDLDLEASYEETCRVLQIW
jgi:Protein of unknown function (DUF4058)